jgi:hypothetical protein
MVTMHKRKTHKKSKAAQIRKLTKQDSLTPAEIATKLGVSVNYVYVVRGQMKQDGLISVFQEGLTRTLPPVDPIAMPVPTSSGKRRGRPPKYTAMQPLPAPLIYIPSQIQPAQIPPKPQNPYGIEASPPIGLWNMFIAKLRRWLAK